MYKIEKNLNKLNKNQPTFFLDPIRTIRIKQKTKKRFIPNIQTIF